MRKMPGMSGYYIKSINSLVIDKTPSSARCARSASERKITSSSVTTMNGGERGALLYGLVGTCRLAYLRYILSELPDWPSNKVAELLPWNMDLTNK